MTSSDIWDEKDAEYYDENAADRFTPDDLDPTVDFLTRLAGNGAALEFAIGTGRVGIALLARGVTVAGIELSDAMVKKLRDKVSEKELPVTIGDMATSSVHGEFSLVFLVWNSISNLRTQKEQVACFQNAARHLMPGGRFVIELWVPPLRRFPPGQIAVPFDIGDGHVGFDTYDTVDQQCTSHHYWTNADGDVRYEAGRFRYLWPSECDLMATLAGMELESRHEDWVGSPFTSESVSHVSVWKKM